MARNVERAIEDWNAWLLPGDRHDKYCDMSTSPFIFYRGSNHLFWSDLADDKRLRPFGNKKTRTWLQGDMHAENMGSFNNNKGEIVYGINDFDDAVIADYQYDVWRMAVSLVLVARQNKISASKQGDAVDAFSRAYLHTMISYAGNNKALRTYFTKDNTCKTLSKFLKDVEKEDTRKEMLKKWTVTAKDKRFFSLSTQMKPPVRVTEKLSPISESERTAMYRGMPRYGKTLARGLKYDKSYFKIEDIAHRLLAGTGSTGTPRYYVLIQGNAKKTNDDRILDVKRQSKPTAYSYFDSAHQKEFDVCFPNPGARHAAAYRSLTTVRAKKSGRIYSDDHLGWMNFFDSVNSVRERSPQKETFPTDTLTSISGLKEMAEQYAIVLATAHARAHGNFKRKPTLYPLADQVAGLLKGKHRKFRELVEEVAFGYANQVAKDYRVFKAALGPKDCPPPD
jgi:uncharacterized protein (DUF2252 family)